MIWKFLSPISILVGLVGAVGILALLWPVGANGLPIGFAAFLIFAGVWELVRRILPGAAKKDGQTGSRDAP